MAITIANVRTFITCPEDLNLVVVRVETSEPGLVGHGCATFTQRCKAVEAAVEHHLRPLLIGRAVSRIEELFALMMQHGYWRNGPVLNNAAAGVDMALWDIKGKLAGLPLYDLLGGKCREAAAVYRHAAGPDIETLLERVAAYEQEQVRHVRVQIGAPASARLHPGSAGYGGPPTRVHPPAGALDGAYYDPRLYIRTALAAIEAARERFPDLELIHDVHERLDPRQAVEFAKRLEPYRLFYLEDLLSPEDLAWFANLRAACTTPLAMGELFVHPREWTPLVTERLIDFVRMHVSFTGGITPARKIAALAELHGVRTAWHGPNDLTPIGHAVNVHLDLASPAFGIQEFCPFGDVSREIFSGGPELRGGYLYLSDAPGIGVEFNEAAAARHPFDPKVEQWTQARLPDGSLHRP